MTRLLMLWLLIFAVVGTYLNTVLLMHHSQMHLDQWDEMNKDHEQIRSLILKLSEKTSKDHLQTDTDHDSLIKDIAERDQKLQASIAIGHDSLCHLLHEIQDTLKKEESASCAK